MTDMNRRDLLFEIGTEEIPARFVEKAADDLKQAGEKLLREARFCFKSARVYATPRRLAFYVEGLTEFQEDIDRRVKGPSAKAAMDPNGKLTRAAEGFAKAQGVQPEDLQRISDSTGDYLYAFVHEKGKRIREVLPALCDGLIRSLAFPKNMRWGSSDFKFVRPIRWMVLMWGDESLPFCFEGIEAGTLSRGHRTLGPLGPVSIKNAESYLDAMKSAGIVADQDEREALIIEQVQSVALELGGDAVIERKLLEEIKYIVEWPTAFGGSFDPKFLSLPEVCVTTPMEGHQRYFPVKANGSLLNRFIAVRNGGEAGLANVRHGNERVLAARLQDARFFFEDDIKTRLEAKLPKLAGISFVEGLGSMKEKSERATKLASSILESGLNGIETGEIELGMLREAGLIMKCDLATNMVREFTELQGEIGAIYASLEGKDVAISAAISEHYLPKYAGGELPITRMGAALAMADRADSLAGYFGKGQIPTGSADPNALRRSALGLIAIHEAFEPGIGILEILGKAIDGIWQSEPIRPRQEILKDLEEFMTGRQRGQLIDEGHRYDLVDAAMSLGAERPRLVRMSLGALEKVTLEGWLGELGLAFVRVRNIAKNAKAPTYSTAYLKELAEVELSIKYEAAKADIGEMMKGDRSIDSFVKAMERFGTLKPYIDSFFEKIMVMCEDKMVSENRLGLIKSIENLALQLADFSKIMQ